MTPPPQLVLKPFISQAATESLVVTSSTRLSPAVEIALALSAAPAHLRAGAAVYVYDSTGYRPERPGTNGFTCLVNRDSFLDGYEALKPVCLDAEGTRTILPMILRAITLRQRGVATADIRRAIDSLFQRGELRPPGRLGVAYMLQGDVTALESTTGRVLARSFGPHLMFYAPGVSNADLGFDAATAGPQAPFIYRRSRYHGYLIVPAGSP